MTGTPAGEVADLARAYPGRTPAPRAGLRSSTKRPALDLFGAARTNAPHPPWRRPGGGQLRDHLSPVRGRAARPGLLGAGTDPGQAVTPPPPRRGRGSHRSPSRRPGRQSPQGAARTRGSRLLAGHVGRRQTRAVRKDRPLRATVGSRRGRRGRLSGRARQAGAGGRLFAQRPVRPDVRRGRRGRPVGAARARRRGARRPAPRPQEQDRRVRSQGAPLRRAPARCGPRPSRPTASGWSPGARTKRPGSGTARAARRCTSCPGTKAA
jgi:hypothetical protein